VGLAAVTAVLTLVGVGFVRAVRPLASSRVVALRHAVLRLTRPGNQTRAVLLSVGLGAFFIVGVRSLQANLLDQFSVTLGGDGADMFLIDVQPAQAEGVARVTAVSGEGSGRQAGEEGGRREGMRHEYTVTWRDRLQPNERVVEGQFWGGGRTDAPEVSIEQSLRDRSGIRLGDVVTFDVLGREISARVTSVRAVDWRDARQGGFMFVFRPGPLDGAPGTFVAPVRAPSDPAARARLQRGVVDRFPNVSVIDLREILQIVGRVIANVTLAVSIVGGLVLFVGGLILVGSVSMTRFQRIYEVAIFRTLGAGTRLLTLMTALEYGVLGAMAGAIGSTAAIALTYAVSRYALNIPWSPRLSISLAGMAVTAVVVCVLRRRPLGSLRSE
jgi:putative ABC transport system permease protein